MNTKKTLYLIRHGQTDYNLNGIIQGSGVDSDLNQTGIEQAQQFYQRYKHHPFDAVLTSKLKRTIQSVSNFTNDGLPHLAMPELNEINWGIFEGLKSTPSHHQVYLDMINRWQQGELNVAVENGETPDDLFKRQQIGLDKILKLPHETVLICMHGRAMRSFLCLLTGKPLHQMDHFPHTNLCLYQLSGNSQGQFTISLENDTSHFK